MSSPIENPCATGQNRRPGRPAAMEGGRSRRIYIDEASWELARKLGNGNGSEGIRRALKIASEAA